MIVIGLTNTAPIRNDRKKIIGVRKHFWSVRKHYQGLAKIRNMFLIYVREAYSQNIRE